MRSDGFKLTVTPIAYGACIGTVLSVLLPVPTEQVASAFLVFAIATELYAASLGGGDER